MQRLRLAALKGVQKTVQSNVFPCFPNFPGLPSFTNELRLLRASESSCVFPFCQMSLSKMDTASRFGLYRNVGSILEEFEKHENIPEVKQLLDIYNNAKTKSDEQKQVAQHPFIVLEGLDGSGKTSMSKALTKKIHGQRWVTPPESTKHLRPVFDDHPVLRTPYYSLGNYIAALEVSCSLHETPVLMDRYWHSTTAYVIGQYINNQQGEMSLPDSTDEIYKWPDDLLKPTRVLFLDVSEEVRLERHSRRNSDLVTNQEKLLKDNLKFRENVIQAFKNMREPAVTVVDGDGAFNQTLYKLLNTIKPLLQK